jgi:hypothetical protein
MSFPKRKRKSPRPRRGPGASLREWREQIEQYELLPIIQQLQNISRGERGEKVVGAALDELCAEDYQTVHAIRRDGCDIDHVLVGPGGVFVIETKHPRGTGVITFRNGQGLFRDEKRWYNNAIDQAKRGAQMVSGIVQKQCAVSEGVLPVVVFVGKWRVADQWQSTDVRVFTPETLKTYICDQQPVLKRSEIELIASHLEQSANN